MLGGRGKLRVLAEISGPLTGETKVGSLRRRDLEALNRLEIELKGRRVVLVSGDAELAGAIALAGAAGASGRRTVLLECDLLLPRLAASLGLAAKPGLHEYMRREASAPQILQPLVLAGPASTGASHPLVCIVAGERAPAPAALIDPEGFRHVVAKLRAAYDRVFLVGPSPGLGRVGLDAVAAQADVLLAAVSPEAIAGQAGRALRTRLRKLPVEVRGAVVVGNS